METTMANDLKAASYAEMVAETEAAVAAVKDPELRRVAFEKILSTLLEREASGSGPARRNRKLPQSKRRSSAGAKRATGKVRRGPLTHINELFDEGFFKKDQTIAQVKAELTNRGHHIPLTSLSGPLQQLTREKKLHRQKMRVNKKGTKTTYAYRNW